MRHVVSKTIQREAYARTHGICVICGKPISKNESEWSVEHFVPRAVYKWVHDSETKSIIEGNDNIFIVHASCNYSKDSALPTNQLIKSMHADKKTKDDMRSLYRNVEGSVDEYRAIKQSVLAKQNSRCAGCGKIISFTNSTLRRKNNNIGRSKENAMCLCESCNVRASSFETKKRMINGSYKKAEKKRKKK